MQKLKEETNFHQKTETFDLTVTLKGDKLNFLLKDFTDWSIYSNQYTKDDIGKQIDHKMSLNDIYSAFSVTKSSIDQNSIQERAKLQNYKLGTLVLKDGDPCYRIQKQGKITTYLSIIDKRTKQQTTYQSCMKLKKIKDFTQIQLLREMKERKDIQDQSIFDELMKRCQKKDARIAYLEKQNKNLKEQLKVSKQKENQNMNIKNVGGLVNQHVDYFSVRGSKVKYRGDKLDTAQYMFDLKILYKKSAKFELRIIQTKHRYIMIGIVDTNQSDRSSYNSGKAMCYYARNGSKYPEKINEGNGYQTGDIVEVDVDRFMCTVKYFVNGVLQASHSNQMLADANRVFVPFVEMQTQNDVVEWVGALIE